MSVTRRNGRRFLFGFPHPSWPHPFYNFSGRLHARAAFASLTRGFVLTACHQSSR